MNLAENLPFLGFSNTTPGIGVPFGQVGQNLVEKLPDVCETALAHDINRDEQRGRVGNVFLSAIACPQQASPWTVSTLWLRAADGLCPFFIQLGPAGIQAFDIDLSSVQCCIALLQIGGGRCNGWIIGGSLASSHPFFRF